MRDGPRYEDDFYAWTQYQAEVLRTMVVADDRFDRENMAEEIEALGRSERDAVRSRIPRIVEHLLKLACSRAEPPRFDWMETIDDARETLSDQLTATCRRDAEASLESFVRKDSDGPRALRRHGKLEAAERLPVACPLPLDEICREDWYPAPANADGL